VEDGSGEGVLVGGHGPLVLGRSVYVVEHTCRQAPPGHRTKIGHARGPGQPAPGAVPLDRTEADHRAERPVRAGHDGWYLRSGIDEAMQARSEPRSAGSARAVRACTAMLPIAVASTGPAMTGRPVASAVSRQRS
jgi:hypothetical protein